ncbi:hypothetical protein HBO19_02145 [Pseudomonas sp. WS 5021]|uniref:hypothetical protein n=1 Tax=Pseudomonas sp. WS 5021 TaxID=2717490 RepID=UPI001473F2FC|nr:hypothetical protein [Pseudomonas sp. WS 5021]NMY24774.1 hypothetical protein [Pseudomonas sp. WS 5021]
MDMNAGLPSLPNSSGAGDQKQGAQDQIEQEPAPLQGVLSATIQGLVNSSPKSMGKDAAPIFIAGIVQHLNSDNEILKLQLESRNRELRESQRQLSDSQIKAARLDEQLKAANGNSRIGQWTGLIGGPLLGISVDLYKNSVNASYLLGILGFCVLLLPIVVNFKRKQG